ncbi:unnamed protein product [Mytilus coruscus]|uniref:Uncharacterized protein n=1 Tax=Mytilus coruscus TaxID=42192 RepID=A0A6J8AP80_MYTCO|nr:unnamed protein product [Mytilus coruscus]
MEGNLVCQDMGGGYTACRKGEGYLQYHKEEDRSREGNLQYHREGNTYSITEKKRDSDSITGKGRNNRMTGTGILTVCQARGGVLTVSKGRILTVSHGMDRNNNMSRTGILTIDMEGVMYCMTERGYLQYDRKGDTYIMLRKGKDTYSRTGKGKDPQYHREVEGSYSITGNGDTYSMTGTGRGTYSMKRKGRDTDLQYHREGEGY